MPDRPKQKLILVNDQSPGDVIMLTAAVRDLHACYPNQFLTDVRTLWPALWAHNPHLTPLNETEPGVRVLACHYPLINASNFRGVHFLHGFIEYLNQHLHLAIKPTRFQGDLHLAEVEKDQPFLQEVTGLDVPYWVIVAGGKFDYTIKWWHFRRWQAVVDQLQGRVLFVQVGADTDYHPMLNGVLDLRGKTSLRDLVRLTYHADGVVCPVTLLMHLAAAVECAPGRGKARPCVVVAGGREPPHWEAYPAHQFIHTVGLLPCCGEGGCWRSRSVPIGDGDAKDAPEQLCLSPVNHLPQCMDLITPEMVTQRIELYLHSPTLTGRTPPWTSDLTSRLACRPGRFGIDPEGTGHAPRTAFSRYQPTIRTKNEPYAC